MAETSLALTQDAAGLRHARPPQPSFVVGFRAWIWQNEDLAAELQISPHAFLDPEIQILPAAQLEQIHRLLEKHVAGGRVFERFLELGRAAVEKGVCRTPLLREGVLSYDRDDLEVACKVFYPLETSWNAIDGTFNIADDWKMRYRIGPAWHDNSCSMDAPLALIIRANLGLVREDQCVYGPISRHGLYWRKVLRQAWGRADNKQRQSMRDMSRVLNPDSEFCKGLIREKGFGSAVLFYEEVMRNAPQVTGHTITCYRCCDRVLVWEEGVRTVLVRFVVRTQNTAQAANIGTFLTEFFGWRPSAGGHGRCSRGESCVGGRMKRYIWLDRPGPTMPVVLQGFSIPRGREWGVFEDVEWVYATQAREWRVRYSLNGFIWKSENHFIARTRAPDGTMLHHNGKVGQGVARELKIGWADRIPTAAVITMLQYEQQGLATAVL